MLAFSLNAISDYSFQRVVVYVRRYIGDFTVATRERIRDFAYQ